MYLNYLLNPGSLSYLPTNGPVVRHSTLQCHSSVKPQSDQAGTLASRWESKKWQRALWWQSSELQAQFCRSDVNLCVRILNPHRMTSFCFFIGRYQYLYYPSPPGVAVLFCWSLRILSLLYCDICHKSFKTRACSIQFKYFEACCSQTLLIGSYPSRKNHIFLYFYFWNQNKFCMF